MKNVYSSVVITATFLTISVLLAVGSALFSSNVVDAHGSKPLPRVYHHGVSAPAFSTDAITYYVQPVKVHVFDQKTKIDVLKERIEIRKKEIDRLKEEIAYLEQEMIETLGETLQDAQKTLDYLSRKRLSQGKVQRGKHITDKHPDKLSFGDRNSDVHALQVFLNKNSFTLAESGAGAPGEETNYFGPRTRRALQLFQKAKGVAVTGIVDEATEAVITAASDASAATENTESLEKETEKTQEEVLPDMSQDEAEEPKQTLFSHLKRIFQSIFGERK